MIGVLHGQREGRSTTVEACGRTHVGLKRGNNEDDLLVDPLRGLFVVIDGMGGQAAGEVAAAITRQVLEERGDRELAPALAEAARLIRAREASDLKLLGMGCVATAVRLRGERLEVAHVGDTRAWLAGPTGCQRLTRDHTLAAEVREQELLTGEAAGVPPIFAHAVTRDLGGRSQAGHDWVDCATHAVHPGDLVLLCSDGLHDHVEDMELVQRLSRARESGQAVRALVDELIELALSRGGHDNITVIAARVLAPQHPRPPMLVLWLALFTGVLLGVALGLKAVEAGYLGVAYAPPEAPAAPPAPRVLDGFRVIDGAALPARLEGTQDVMVVGTAPASGRLEVAPGARVHIRGLRMTSEEVAAEGAPPLTWTFVVGEGAEVELSQWYVNQPTLDLRWELGAGSVVWLGGHINVRSAVVSGDPSATLHLDIIPRVVEGSTLRVNGPVPDWVPSFER